MYAIFTALTVRDAKPTLPNGINGGWLVAVVATQSLCVLGTNTVSYTHLTLPTSDLV